jgi:hypothetical protein
MISFNNHFAILALILPILFLTLANEQKINWKMVLNQEKGYSISRSNKDQTRISGYTSHKKQRW